MWAEEFNKARSDEKRQVPMLYLANEVLHTGTKKCPDWVQHFASHLPGCLSKLPTGSVVHQKAQRLAQIWRERDILGTGISKVYQVLGVAGPSAPPAAGRPSRAPSKGPKSPSKGGQKVAAAWALRNLAGNKTNLAAMKDLGYGKESFFGGWTVP